MLDDGRSRNRGHEVERWRRYPDRPSDFALGRFVPGEVAGRRFDMAAVKSREEAIGRLVSAEAEVRALGVRRLALFGSFARGEADAASDVDILVEFNPEGKTYDRFLELCELLERVLQRHVEVVTTEALSPYIGPHILAEAEDVV